MVTNVPSTPAILSAIFFPAICCGLILHESFPVSNTENTYHCLKKPLILNCPINKILSIRHATFQMSNATTCPTTTSHHHHNAVVATNHHNDVISAAASHHNHNSNNVGDDGDDGGADKCVINVLEYFESSCFAKLSCHVPINGNLEEWKSPLRTKGCPEGNNFIINVTYDCVGVEKSACFDCNNGGIQARIVGQKGFLGSIVALLEKTSTFCGTSKCPWYFQVAPGKVVNFTIIESGKNGKQLKSPGDSSSSLSSSSSSSSSSCNQNILSVRELRKDYPYCSGENRINHLHLSLSNVVEVSFNDDLLSDVKPQFLVFYEVLGCADLTPPKYSRMRRSGNDMVIDCPGTDSKWALKCINGSWIDEKSVGTCPKFPGLEDAESAMQQTDDNIFNTSLLNMPTGVLMALVLSTAVILGVLILTTGLVCLKRHQFEVKHKDDPNVYGAACSEFEFREMGAAGTSLLHGKSPFMNGPKQRRASADLLARDNTYAMQDMRMDTRPLPSLPNATSPHDTWRRNDGQGPIPYGIFPGNQAPNRVTVQFHRADNGADVLASGYPIPGGTYRGRYPANQGYPSTMHSGQMQPRYMGPVGTNTGRFDPRSMAPQRRPSGNNNNNNNSTSQRIPNNNNNSSNYDPGHNNSDDNNHLYFVLDDNAKEMRNDQTGGRNMALMMPNSTLPQPPPAHQQFPGNPRFPPQPMAPGAMMTHRHQASVGGGIDPRCTCDDHGPYKSSGSLNNQL